MFRTWYIENPVSDPVRYENPGPGIPKISSGSGPKTWYTENPVLRVRYTENPVPGLVYRKSSALLIFTRFSQIRFWVGIDFGPAAGGNF